MKKPARNTILNRIITILIRNDYITQDFLHDNQIIEMFEFFDKVYYYNLGKNFTCFSNDRHEADRLWYIYRNYSLYNAYSTLVVWSIHFIERKYKHPENYSVYIEKKK